MHHIHATHTYAQWIGELERIHKDFAFPRVLAYSICHPGCCTHLLPFQPRGSLCGSLAQSCSLMLLRRPGTWEAPEEVGLQRSKYSDKIPSHLASGHIQHKSIHLIFGCHTVEGRKKQDRHTQIPHSPTSYLVNEQSQMLAQRGRPTGRAPGGKSHLGCLLEGWPHLSGPPWGQL